MLGLWKTTIKEKTGEKLIMGTKYSQAQKKCFQMKN